MHGGANGTDKVAAAIAMEMGCEIVELLPDYERYGAKAAPVIRNAELVKLAKQLHARVVAYQPDGPTKGTQDTIRRALAAGLKVEEWRGGEAWQIHEPAPTLAL